MTEGKNRYSLVWFAAIFAAAYTLSFLMGRMIVSNTVLSPVSPDFSAVSPVYSVLSIFRSCRSTAMQLLLMYLAGYSAFAFPVSAAVCAYRGVALGHTCSLLLSNRILASGTPFIPQVPSYVAVFILYIASTAVLLSFSCLSVYFFKDIRSGRTQIAGKYTKQFILTAGVTSVLDIIRGFIV